MASQQATATATAPSELSKVNVTSEPKTFHSFRKLAPELRNMIWKFAAPGPRIVPVAAGSSFRQSLFSCKNKGEHTIEVVEKYEFKIGFTTHRNDHGMLRACKESRHIMLQMLPIRLRSNDPMKELRLGPHDSLWIADPGEFFNALAMALKYELKIPIAVSQIPALCFRANSPQRGGGQYLISIDSFMDTVMFDMTFRKALLALKGLQSIVFCLSSEPQIWDEECFSSYTADFDYASLKPRRSRLFHFAKSHAEDLENRMKQWQDREKDKYPNLPEVKIMAKGWPVKKITASKRVNS